MKRSKRSIKQLNADKIRQRLDERERQLRSSRAPECWFEALNEVRKQLYKLQIFYRGRYCSRFFIAFFAFIVKAFYFDFKALFFLYGLFIDCTTTAQNYHQKNQNRAF